MHGLVLCLAAASAPQGPPPSTANSTTYEIQVELAAEEKRLLGAQRLTWTNQSGAATGELQFHLYLNAFRDRRSTFMREADEDFRERWRPHEFGWIAVREIELVSADVPVDLSERQRFIQPDDANRDDATVMAVELPAPVAAGETIELRLSFEVQVPKAYRRTGYLPGDGFFFMHWFPKLGVLEERDGVAVWNCHQFHANTEFFADFATYEVEIDVPEDHVVGASGVLQADRTRRASGRKTLAYRVENVHDFAWVSDPDFVRYEETFGPVEAGDDPFVRGIADRLGQAAREFDLPETRIILLLRPEHDTESQRQRHFEAIRCALQFYGLRYGPYPYPTITAVDPGADVLGRRLGGGMEYPTLITCGTQLFLHPRALQPESVTVHEFGHQYWYGLSANNEFEESWLDEGLNTYSEGRAQSLHYRDRLRPTAVHRVGLLPLAGSPGPLSWQGAEMLPVVLWRDLVPTWVRQPIDDSGFRGTLMPKSPLLELMREQPMATYAREVAVGDLWNDRDRWLSVDNPDAMVMPGWQYLNRATYGVNSYTRPATVLRTLERMVGRATWWAFLRRFHGLARFSHPTTDDFTQLLAETCGDAAADFFVQATRAQASFDYGIQEVRPVDGRGDDISVIVRRFGWLPADVRVRFRFEGSSEPEYQTMPADHPAPWKRFRFVAEDGQPPRGRLLEVWVDPPEPPPGTEPFAVPAWPVGVFPIDENLLDNAWRADADHGPAFHRGIRWMLQTQTQLAFAGLIG